MLKIFFVVMLFSQGMSEPLVKRELVESYQECIDKTAKVASKAEELNKRGGAISEFKVITGCEFASEKSDPS